MCSALGGSRGHGCCLSCFLIQCIAFFERYVAKLANEVVIIDDSLAFFAIHLYAYLVLGVGLRYHHFGDFAFFVRVFQFITPKKSA